MSLHRGGVQRRHAVLRIGAPCIGPFFDQQDDHGGFAAPGRFLQGRRAAIVAGVHLRAVGDESLRDSTFTAPRRQMQRSQPRPIDFGAVREQRLDNLETVHQHRVIERCRLSLPNAAR